MEISNCTDLETSFKVVGGVVHTTGGESNYCFLRVNSMNYYNVWHGKTIPTSAMVAWASCK